MAIFKLLDTQELEEFAADLAADMARRFPPTSESRTDAGAVHQLKVILVGVYRKAKLGNVFRWKLKELGYSPAFVERATKELVTRLAIK